MFGIQRSVVRLLAKNRSVLHTARWYKTQRLHWKRNRPELNLVGVVGSNQRILVAGLGVVSIGAIYSASLSKSYALNEEVSNVEEKPFDPLAVEPTVDADSSTQDLEPAQYSAVFVNDSVEKELSAKLSLVVPQGAKLGVLCHRELDNEILNDLDDLCDNEVGLNIIGTLAWKNTSHKAILVELDHLHIKSRDKIPTLEILYEDSCPARSQPEWILSSLKRLLKATGANSVKEVENFTGNSDDPETQDIEYTTFVSGKSSETSDFKGTFCLDRDWEQKTGKCNYDRQNKCAFCLFMKSGPCRKIFIAWEQCVDHAKDEGDEDDDSFIDKCASQTLALKECVDKNPDYYYSLEDTETKAEEPKQEEKQEKKS